MRKLALAVLILAVPALAGAQSKKGAPARKPAATPLAPKVAVAGLRVVGPGYGPEDGQARPFNYDKGTTVVLAVRVAPPNGLVGMDKNKSSVEMADSQGHALEQPEVDWNPDFAKDGSAAVVDLDAKGVPGDGSTFVTAKGTLMFTAATGTRTVKVPNVKLEKGTTFKLGTAIVTLGDVDKGDEGPTVMFQGTRPLIKGIRALRARDAKGAAVDAHWSSSGTWTGEDGYQTSYRFKTAAPAITLEFDLWDGLREVPVPFDVKAGVALPAQ